MPLCDDHRLPDKSAFSIQVETDSKVELDLRTGNQCCIIWARITAMGSGGTVCAKTGEHANIESKAIHFIISDLWCELRVVGW